MFKKEGTFVVTVVEADIEECRFPAKEGDLNAFGQPVQKYYDVCLLVQDEEGTNDYWSGEISNDTGKGNTADKTRTELTLQTLQEIGFNVQTLQDLEAQFQPTADRTICIPNLVGIKCKAVVKARTYKDKNNEDKTAYRIVYLNNINASVGGGTKLNFDSFMAARTQPQAAPAVQPPPVQPVQQYQQPAAMPQYQQPITGPQYQQPAAAPQQYQQPPQGYQPPAVQPPQNPAASTACPY